MFLGTLMLLESFRSVNFQAEEMNCGACSTAQTSLCVVTFHFLAAA